MGDIPETEMESIQDQDRKKRRRRSYAARTKNRVRISKNASNERWSDSTQKTFKHLGSRLLWRLNS